MFWQKEEEEEVKKVRSRRRRRRDELRNKRTQTFELKYKKTIKDDIYDIQNYTNSFETKCFSWNNMCGGTVSVVSLNVSCGFCVNRSRHGVSFFYVCVDFVFVFECRTKATKDFFI